MERNVLAKMVYIRKHHREMTCRELSSHLRMPMSWVRSFCYRNGLQLKQQNRKLTKEEKAKEKLGKREYAPRIVAEPHTPIQRPPATYQNLPSPYGIADELHGKLNKPDDDRSI